jgi:dipicolinate synthase subunit A
VFTLVIGGDLRYAHLTRLAASCGAQFASLGMERCPLPCDAASLDDIPRADALILPNPWRGGMMLPFAASPFSLDDVLSRARSGIPIFLSDTARMPTVTEDFRWVDLSADEEYVLYNAHLTAEGAVSHAMRSTDRALMGSQCLLIGYGRIARRLCELLTELGAHVTVAARREESRLHARLMGAHACSTDELSLVLPEMDFIFSTPPALVLDESLLRLIRPDAHLMDLASPPYGFDLKLALSLSLNAVRESGLPGRYCPFSAGSALLEAVRRALNIHMKGDLLCF